MNNNNMKVDNQTDLNLKDASSKNENKVDNSNKGKMGVKKIVLGVLVLAFIAFLLFCLLSDGANELGKTVIIEHDNVEITVNSAKEVELKDDLFNDSGKYIKVNITVKNNSDKDYIYNMFGNYLLNKKDKSKIYFDSLNINNTFDTEIKAHSENVGDLYFKTSNISNYKFIYYIEYFEDNNHMYDKYEFKLK